MIYLDIDGVIADTYPHLFRYVGMEVPEITEYSDPRFLIALKEVGDDPAFWLTIPVRQRPTHPPQAYITHRTQPSCLTSYWLAINDIAYAPVITLNSGVPKIQYMARGGILVDDNPSVFKEFENRESTCYLMDQPYNRHIDTPLRIKSLSELTSRL